MNDRPRCARCGCFLNTWSASAGAELCSACSPVVRRATCKRGHLKADHWRPSRNDCRECARILKAERRAQYVAPDPPQATKHTSSVRKGDR